MSIDLSEVAVRRFRFPDWPGHRLVTEAARSWNLRHHVKLDPQSSPWSRIYATVLAFVRHSLTSYDQQLDLVAAGGSNPAEHRTLLRKKIHASARMQYPWLRLSVDPRPSWTWPAPTKRSSRILDEASRARCDAIEQRAHILSLLRSPEVRTNPAAREQARQALREIDVHIERLGKFFEHPLPAEPGFADMRFLIWKAHNAYQFACLEDVPENYLRTTDAVCPHCHKRIIKTKRALAVGAGVRLVCYSCCCTSIGVTPKHDSERSMLRCWPEFVADLEKDNQTQTSSVAEPSDAQWIDS